MKKFYFLLLSFLALSLCANAAVKTGTITFGPSDVKVAAATVKANDNLGNSWTITTVGTTSFTNQNGNNYSQIGKSTSPATSITFVATLPSTVTVNSVEAKFGGFSKTAGAISIKVGDTEVGTGSLNATTDVTVKSTTSADGNAITISITDIAKGVKAYYITYTYDDGKGGSTVTVAEPEISASSANYGTAYFTNSTATAKITCATTDATIKYAITDGTAEPTTWSDYSKGAVVEIASTEPATKTLWAKAVKGLDESTVAKKEFTFINPPKQLTFTKVTDASQLVAGAKYAIINATTTKIVSGYDGSTYTSTTTSASDGIVTTMDNAVIVFTLGGNGDADNSWTLFDNTKGKYVGGGSKTSFAFGDDASELSNWTITFVDTKGSVKIYNGKRGFNFSSSGAVKNYATSNYGANDYTYPTLWKMVEGTETGLDAVLVGEVGNKYQINTPLCVNYKDDNYVYASTTKGGFTKTAPTEAQKEEWWSDKAADFNQNDWVAIQGLVDVQVGAEIEAGSVATLVSNDAFPVVEFVTESHTTGTAIEANTFRVANFVDSDNELVKKLWLVDPQPAEHCYVKGYVASLGDVVEIDGVFVAEIKSGEKDVVTMYVNYNPADFSITATGWYLFEGVVVNGTSGLELNAVNVNEGTATGVEGVETSSVKVYGAEGVINVESEEVAPIAVYSANGAIVSSVEASSASIAVAPGFYIVKAGNSVSKVTVK